MPRFAAKIDHAVARSGVLQVRPHAKEFRDLIRGRLAKQNPVPAEKSNVAAREAKRINSRFVNRGSSFFLSKFLKEAIAVLRILSVCGLLLSCVCKGSHKVPRDPQAGLQPYSTKIAKAAVACSRVRRIGSPKAGILRSCRILHSRRNPISCTVPTIKGSTKQHFMMRWVWLRSADKRLA